MTELTGEECIAWVAQTVDGYAYTGQEKRFEDAVWKLDQVLLAYAHVRGQAPLLFGMSVPAPLRTEIAVPCEAILEAAIDDWREAMAQQFGDVGMNTFFQHARRQELRLPGDPGPGVTRTADVPDVRRAAVALIDRLGDRVATTAHWRASEHQFDAATAVAMGCVTIGGHDIHEDEIVACIIRRPLRDLDARVAELADRGVIIPADLIAFYRECDGVAVGWVDAEDADPDDLFEHQLFLPFAEVVDLLDEHSPSALAIGTDAAEIWFFDRDTGSVYNRDETIVHTSLLSHVRALAATYGNNIHRDGRIVGDAI